MKPARRWNDVWLVEKRWRRDIDVSSMRAVPAIVTEEGITGRRWIQASSEKSDGQFSGGEADNAIVIR